MNLCRCGCGQDAGVWPQSYKRWGIRKGDPRKYLFGHYGKKDIYTMFSVDAETGCWVWTGNIESGYGRIGSRLAYRVFYERHKGSVPYGMQLDHVCRNRSCVNPDHLEPVTKAENVRRGRAAKLTKDAVVEIRRVAKVDPSLEARAMLAVAFGVKPGTIKDVAAFRSWTIDMETL